METIGVKGNPESYKPSSFDAVNIALAAPETIRSWSFGEVKNPETINYRTYKPERGGLFCERIFGPQRDWECSCGKYKRIKHKGVLCDRCGVEVTLSRVRRERMGHIELAVPVSHIWFFKCTPSRLGLIVDLTARSLERILYYEDYVVVDPGKTPLKEKQILSEEEYREAGELYGEEFSAKMGAEAIRDLMKRIDLAALMASLEAQMGTTRSQQTRKKLANRMKIVESMRLNAMRPEWTILEVLPVIPPDLRPLVPLEGGRFATSDLNDLYRRVINRNNRLKNLLILKTPDVIIRNEKRMLQEAVDALLDNGRHGRPVTGSGNRPLKSLSDMLKGKQGRFRQNLLGKRVDYSGRSVIVVGPELSLHQCGLPKKMALTLFEPFIIRRLKQKGLVHTVRAAKKMIESQTNVIWDALDEVIKGRTVMLNRAPTLHRLSVQSFEPILIEGDAIQIHPLVCTAFNADFDGDQMAVHVPLSIEAQLESRLLMLSTNNLFSPSSGRPVMTPTQDIALGIYYLTMGPSAAKNELFLSKADEEIGQHLPIFGDANEVQYAFDMGQVKVHTRIRFRNPDYKKEKTVYGKVGERVIATTVGRVFFNRVFPHTVGFINETVTKKLLSTIIWKCYHAAGQAETVQTLDLLKTLGFKYATLTGISIGLVDMIVPEDKAKIIEEARRQVKDVERQYQKGIITEGERYNKIIDIWTRATEETAAIMIEVMQKKQAAGEPNPLFMMVDSGARGSRQQIRQLAGMRGLMAKPSGEIIERPILSNFREGLSVLEYFISTHGARKGLADTALKTADAGYLTRKLVDVAQDVIITEQDCSTLNGIRVSAISGGVEIPLGLRIIGRTALEDVFDPRDPKKRLVAAGHEISETDAEAIEQADIENVKIRSVLTCEVKRGACAKCYGRDLTTDKLVELGTAVGIIAAQSIGEPGTQLTMRTFHIGGAASSRAGQTEIKAKNSGIVHFSDVRMVKDVQGDSIVLNKNGSVVICDNDGRELEQHDLVVGSAVSVNEGDTVTKGHVFVRWEPHSVPIIAEQSGIVHFRDFVENVSMKIEVDQITSFKRIVILDYREDLHPQIMIKDNKTNAVLGNYSIPSGAYVFVEKGKEVSAGMVLAKTPRKEAKTKDITGGLPRVAELFEARRPKGAAEISKIAGVVDFGGIQRGTRRLIVRDTVTGDEEEHIVALGKHVIVSKGDHVKKGEPLTEGPIVPQEVLEVCGPQDLQEYLVNEVQEVYRLQGVEINDKHIEVIVRQMLKKVRITDQGDTEFLWNELVDKYHFQEVNQKAMAEGKRPAQASPCLLGVTKASIETESFISAASFQDTTRVLTTAATLGKVDHLFGFKENVIMGHLIPAGVGFSINKHLKLVHLGEPIPEAALPKSENPEDKLRKLLN
ncbi:MAG: DNA-directed RNA polymerase subunit beta' [Verrucomicrobia bacterium]|nr:DNA-directed RNA polymerase subunit beta' [Verrucomicrobiota bacterium]